MNLEQYLRPTSNIDCDNPTIIEKARTLAMGLHDEVEKSKRLFYFVRDDIKFNPYRFILAPEYYRASQTLNRGDGFCMQKAVLLVALARSLNIPSRLIFADIRNHLANKEITKFAGTNLFIYHGYCEIYNGKRWIKAAPIFDLKTCEEDRLIPVEYNGKSDAILYPMNRDGEKHIEYVNFHGHYDDVPLDEIIEKHIHVYGPEITRLCTTGKWIDSIQE